MLFLFVLNCMLKASDKNKKILEPSFLMILNTRHHFLAVHRKNAELMSTDSTHAVQIPVLAFLQACYSKNSHIWQ